MILEQTPPEYIAVTNPKRLVVPKVPKKQQKLVTSIAGQYAKWVGGEECGLIFEPSNELRQLGLETPDASRQSSMNGRCRLGCKSLLKNKMSWHPWKHRTRVRWLLKRKAAETSLRYYPVTWYVLRTLPRL